MPTNPSHAETIATLLLTLVSPLALLIILLQKDLLTIPYLTPAVHTAWEYLTPPILLFLPLFTFLFPILRPLQLVALLHFLRDRDKKFEFSQQARWIMGGLVLQYVPTVVGVVGVVLRNVVDGREVEGVWLGRAWVEVWMLVGLGVGEGRGWRWDGGVLDRMVAGGGEGVDETRIGRLEKGQAGVDGGEGNNIKP